MSASQPVEHRPTDVTVAVIGSGPSGCYIAQFLRKELPNAEITIFEALPVPYGLVRYGVAADHQGTKAVAKQFDRMFERNGIDFIGNVRVGKDIAFDTLRDAYDVVVVATGLPNDKRLDVPQDPAAHVIGAGRLLRALNSFPDEAATWSDPLDQTLGDDLVVVGLGNVAVDVVRLLTKADHHFTGSDIDDGTLARLRPRRPRTVRMIGRAAASDAKFDLAMLRELCSLDTVSIRAEGLDDDAEGPIADLLRTTVQNQDLHPTSERTTLTFHFRSVPVRIGHENARTVLDVRTPSGIESYPADTVVTAIGFCHPDKTRDDTPVSTWTGSNVYRVGWLDRGGRGNIAENRKHSQQVARSILSDLADGRLPLRGTGGSKLVLPQLSSPIVGFDGWQAIDEAERQAAEPQRCRRKFTVLEDMLAVAGRTRQPC